MSCLFFRKRFGHMRIRLHVYTKICQADHTSAWFLCCHIMPFDGKEIYSQLIRSCYSSSDRVGYLAYFLYWLPYFSSILPEMLVFPGYANLGNRYSDDNLYCIQYVLNNW